MHIAKVWTFSSSWENLTPQEQQLLEAVERGDRHTIESLLEAGVNIYCGSYDNTVLTFATRAPGFDPEFIHWLVIKGVDVTQSPVAFHYAFHPERVEIYGKDDR